MWWWLALSVQELLGCDGAGIMCALAASYQVSYLGRRWPAEELQIDLRGNLGLVDPHGERPVAYIDIGEFKNGGQYKAAIPQMGRTLGLLRWAVSTLYPPASGTCVGRLFATGITPQPDQMDKALRDWGFSLYVHNSI